MHTAVARARHILKMKRTPVVGFEPTKGLEILPPFEGGALTLLIDRGVGVKRIVMYEVTYPCKSCL